MEVRKLQELQVAGCRKLEVGSWKLIGVGVGVMETISKLELEVDGRESEGGS